MAHFAQVDSNNIVGDVIVVNNNVITDDDGVEQESLGQAFIASLGIEGTWLQCSYHKTFRFNFPSFGYYYDKAKDAFIPPKPQTSDVISDWVLNEETFTWEPVEA